MATAPPSTRRSAPPIGTRWTRKSAASSAPPSASPRSPSPGSWRVPPGHPIPASAGAPSTAPTSTTRSPASTSTAATPGPAWTKRSRANAARRRSKRASPGNSLSGRVTVRATTRFQGMVAEVEPEENQQDYELGSKPADYLDINGGLVLFVVGIALIIGSGLLANHQAVAPFFVSFGSILVILGAFYSR